MKLAVVCYSHSAKLKLNQIQPRLKNLRNLFEIFFQTPILTHFFQEPSKTPATCVSAVLNVFSEVLKRKDMTLNDSEDVGKQKNLKVFRPKGKLVEQNIITVA